MLHHKPLLAVLLLQTVFISSAHGQAYCALRDPTRHIYDVYPQATSYRSIVRTVDESVRQRVANELPFTIHFNELGKHTLYLPVRNGTPLGLIHARSEAGRFGLVEIVWSLDPSLRVQEFSFQRCRARSRTAVETDAFKSQLVGMGSRELRGLLSADGTSIASGSLAVPAGAEDLAATVVRSALKTISVTRLVWAKDLRVIRPLYYAHREFPASARVELVSNVYTPEAQQEIIRHFSTDNEATIDRSSVTMLRLYDAGGNPLGHLIRTSWHSLDREAKLWWSVSNGLTINNVFPDQEWPDAEVKESFTDLIGMDINQIESCSCAAEVVGAEILVLSRHN